MWSQDLGSHYPDSAPLRPLSIASLLQPEKIQPIERRLFKSVPASCLPGGRVRQSLPIPITKPQVHHEPQPEWHERLRVFSEKKALELDRCLNPLYGLFGPRRWDYSGGKRGPLYIPQPGEESREYSPLPARARTKGESRPAKGSEEDLILRIVSSRI